MSAPFRWRISLALMTLAVFGFVTADDYFACCMGGWKALRHVSLCDAPCCPGYVEKLVQPPLLKPAIFCEKVAVSSVRERYKAATVTTTPMSADEKLFRHHDLLEEKMWDLKGDD